ncbi:MAG: phosphoribosylglycinamide formyltransferase [Candidatus Thorarchaeota archaeon]|nr:MAG: phosphoribosylglycinamide formyltransferase [Candidatus Thorarchaeota archaeon]
MRRIGVLVSGRGSNLQALLDAESHGELSGQIVVVISNRSQAFALERARKARVQTILVTKSEFPDRQDFDEQVSEVLRSYKVDLVVLAGYMRMFTEQFINEFQNRIINVHPSLLPAFKGVRAQWQAIECGVKVSGCSTHFVTFDMDAGPIIMQKAVPIFLEDTGETLAERILPEEHRILVKSVRLFCEDKLRIDGRHVIIRE